MHPITQTVLALGVLALVAMGGYALVYGVPSAPAQQTSLDRLKAVTADAEDTLCRFNLARD